MLILIVMVQMIQSTFNYASKKMDKRLNDEKASDKGFTALAFMEKFRKGC